MNASNKKVFSRVSSAWDDHRKSLQGVFVTGLSSMSQLAAMYATSSGSCIACLSTLIVNPTRLSTKYNENSVVDQQYEGTTHIADLLIYLRRNSMCLTRSKLVACCQSMSGR